MKNFKRTIAFVLALMLLVSGAAMDKTLHII